MKKYYDLEDEKMVVMLDWKEGFGTMEQAKQYLGNQNAREIDIQEFKKLEKIYCK